MKYVKTSKKHLIDANYTLDIFHGANRFSTDGYTQKYAISREFFETFPAPKQFIIPADKDTRLYDNIVQVLSIWYCRGTELIFPDLSITCTHPIIEWEYSFVTSLPQLYIRKNCCTVKKAYELGSKLIDACIKASKIPFPRLEQAYKDIIKACQLQGIKAYSPNAKTYWEARAENEVEKELEGMFYIDEHDQECYNYSDDEIDHYAKIFDINLPQWFIKQTNIKTIHGFAICPYIDGNPNNNYSSNYAGSLSDDGDSSNHTPLSLLKDAQARKIRNEICEKKQLGKQINFFLHTDFEDMLHFYLGNNWSYCPECDDFYNLSEGCECGLCKPREEISLDSLQAHTRKYKFIED